MPRSTPPSSTSAPTPSPTPLPSFIHRQFAAALLGKTLLELFPEIELRKPQVGQYTFQWQFRLKRSLSDSDLDWLNHQMRRVLLSEPSYRLIETTPFSAAGYFKQPTIHQPALSRTCESAETATLTFIDFDGTWLPITLDPEEVPNSFSLREIRHFQLLSLTHDRDSYTLEGTICEEPKALKNYLKARNKRNRDSHLALGERLKLWTPSPHFIWLPEGLNRLDQMRRECLHSRKEFGSQWVTFQSLNGGKNTSFPSPFPFNKDLIDQCLQLHQQLGWQWVTTWCDTTKFLWELKEEESLLLPKKSFGELTFGLVDHKELTREIERCLRFIVEWSRVRGLEGGLVGYPGHSRGVHELRKSSTGWEIDWEGADPSLEREPGVGYCVCDSLGRRWELGRLSLYPLPASTPSKHWLIVSSAVISAERMLALTLEK